LEIGGGIQFGLRPDNSQHQIFGLIELPIQGGIFNYVLRVGVYRIVVIQHVVLVYYG
jgi:hypothetical protein